MTSGIVGHDTGERPRYWREDGAIIAVGDDRAVHMGVPGPEGDVVGVGSGACRIGNQQPANDQQDCSAGRTGAPYG